MISRKVLDKSATQDKSATLNEPGYAKITSI